MIQNRGSGMNDILELTNRHTGEILRMRKVREAEGPIYLSLDGTLPPGTNGPPPHIHFLEHEEGIVKAGILGARIGGREIVVKAGGSAELPRGIVHSWWNGGNEMLEFSGRVVPLVDLDRYLQAMFAVLNAGSAGRPSIFYLAHVMWRHRQTQALAN